MRDCPVCVAEPGWEHDWGLRHAAQNIRHEAETEEELDLAEMCLWIAETHKPDKDLICVGCGEQWWQDANAGLIQCQTYLNARIEKNFWIMRKVTAIRDRWRHYK